MPDVQILVGVCEGTLEAMAKRITVRRIRLLCPKKLPLDKIPVFSTDLIVVVQLGYLTVRYIISSFCDSLRSERDGETGTGHILISNCTANKGSEN